MASNTTPSLALTLLIKTHMNVQKASWKEIKPVPFVIRERCQKETNAS